MNVFFKKYLCLSCFGLAIALLPDIAQADNVYADLPTLNSITFVSSRGTSGTAIPLTANTSLALTSVGNVNVKSNTYGGFKVDTVLSTKKSRGNFNKIRIERTLRLENTKDLS
jgi:hypothetical protein